MMVGVWAGVGTAQAQTIEAQQEAFRLANDLSNAIEEDFAGGDLRRGYADAIRALGAFAEANADSAAWEILRQLVAGQATGLGMHELALQAMGPEGPLPSVPGGLVAEDAIDAIVNASEGRRVVMLNEAHHVGQHREFARRLLRPLRDAGFTHLACEAFANSDEEGFEVDAKRHGYATQETGHYIADPFFAELVREAVELGFELVPYETLDIRPHGQDSPSASVNRRETDQARQLAAVLDADPGARVLVYCGYAHLTESPMQFQGGEVRWLANRLREATGIDPLTLSQTIYYPREPKKQPAPGIAGYEADDAFVLRSDDGLWSLKPDEYDIELLHPRTSPIDGRPAWVFRADDRECVEIDLADRELGDDAVLVVTRAGEALDAIPSDVVLIGASRTSASVSLRPGAYRVWLVRGGAEPELVASPSVE
jgi:hypothetical protein